MMSQEAKNYMARIAKAEQEWEKSAAFGEGVQVVNMMTGKVTVTKTYNKKTVK